MKLVVINDKIIGEKLAVPIYNTNGILYINQGVELSKMYLSKIQRLGINTVYLEDGNDDFTLQEVISPVIKINLLKRIKNEFDVISRSKKINYKDICSIVEEIINNINLSENAFMFNNIGKLDDSMDLAIHSLDVTILSIMLGVNRGYDSNKLTNLGIGALLHDIGRLVDCEECDHPKEGYKLMKANSRISPTSSIIVLHHHERVDGLGYPDRLKGEGIYEFAKVVSICNEYVKQSFGKEVHFPKEVIEMITAQTNLKFDPSVLKSLTSSVYCYPNGVRVLLTNGKVGTVIMQNKGFPLRPIVRIDESDEHVDLMKELCVFIAKVIIEAA